MNIMEPAAIAQAAPAATAERLAKAKQLMTRALRMADAQHDTFSVQKAWTVVSKCCGSALDFDMRMLSPLVVEAPAAELAKELRGTLAHLTAEPLTDCQWRQTALPTVYGGLGLRAASPEVHALASYWCSVAAAATAVVTAPGKVMGVHAAPPPAAPRRRCIRLIPRPRRPQ